jgi:hypothetical protein
MKLGVLAARLGKRWCRCSHAERAKVCSAMLLCSHGSSTRDLVTCVPVQHLHALQHYKPGVRKEGAAWHMHGTSG